MYQGYIMISKLTEFLRPVCCLPQAPGNKLKFGWVVISKFVWHSWTDWLLTLGKVEQSSTTAFVSKSCVSVIFTQWFLEQSSGHVLLHRKITNAASSICVPTCYLWWAYYTKYHTKYPFCLNNSLIYKLLNKCKFTYWPYAIFVLENVPTSALLLKHEITL